MSGIVKYHVFPADDRWILRPEADVKTMLLYDSKEAALAGGHRLAAAEERAVVVIHKRDGSIAEERTVEQLQHI